MPRAGLSHCRHSVTDRRALSVALRRRARGRHAHPSECGRQGARAACCVRACVRTPPQPHTRAAAPPAAGHPRGHPAAGTRASVHAAWSVANHARRAPKHVVRRRHAVCVRVLRPARAVGAHLCAPRVCPKLGATARHPAHEVGDACSWGVHTRGTPCAHMGKRKERVEGVATRPAPVGVTNLDDRGTLAPPNVTRSARARAPHACHAAHMRAPCLCTNCRVRGRGGARSVRDVCASRRVAKVTLHCACAQPRALRLASAWSSTRRHTSPVQPRAYGWQGCVHADVACRRGACVATGRTRARVRSAWGGREGAGRPPAPRACTDAACCNFAAVHAARTKPCVRACPMAGCAGWRGAGARTSVVAAHARGRIHGTRGCRRRSTLWMLRVWLCRASSSAARRVWSVQGVGMVERAAQGWVVQVLQGRGGAERVCAGGAMRGGGRGRGG